MSPNKASKPIEPLLNKHEIHSLRTSYHIVAAKWASDYNGRQMTGIVGRGQTKTFLLNGEAVSCLVLG